MEALSEIQSGMVRGNPMPPVVQTYLCKEPWERSGSLSPIDQSFFRFSDLERLHSSLDFYSQQNRHRTLEHLQLEIAKLHMRESQWEDAYHILLSLWRRCSWRKRGWWRLVSEVDWALRDLAIRLADVRTLAAVEWELLHEVVPSRPIWNYDFPSMLEGSKVQNDKRIVALSSDDVTSCLSATFAFAALKGHVGVELPFQVVVKCLAHQQVKLLVMRRIDLFFSGGLRNVRILHKSATEESSQTCKPRVSLQHVIAKLDSEENIGFDGVEYNGIGQEVTRAENEKAPLLHAPAGSLLGSADLSISAGSTKVFSLYALPREPGQIKLEKAIVHMNIRSCPLAIVFSAHRQLQQDFLYIKQKKRIERRSQANTTSTSIDILPKPPKLKLQIADPPLFYNTGENMFCELIITNDEEEEVKINLSISSKSVNGHDPLPQASWRNENVDQDVLKSSEHKIQRYLGAQQAGSVQKIGFHIAAPASRSQCILDIDADYTLVSDPDTHVQKLLSLDPDFIDPFDPSIQWSPAVHPAKWPSTFHVLEDDEVPSGLLQRWLLKATLNPSMPTLLAVEGIELIPSKPQQDTKASITELCNSPKLTDEDDRVFQVDVQKLQLDDRRTSPLDFELLIRWRRKSQQSHAGASLSTMRVRTPHLMLSFSEPRVLVAQQGNDTAAEPAPDPNILRLNYTIENPSLHLLTFTLTMEADEDFAFSGPKLITIQLVPLSRHSVMYSILPFRRNKWINPVLKVVDVNFNQTLKVNATGRLRQDDKKPGGLLVWVEE